MGMDILIIKIQGIAKDCGNAPFIISVDLNAFLKLFDREN